MHARLSHGNLRRALPLLGLLALLACGLFPPAGGWRAARAQTGCPPPATDHDGWVEAADVYYDISRFPPEIQDQLREAFDRWNAANRQNGSNVTFRPADSAHPPNYIVRPGLAQGPQGNGPAITHPSGTGGDVASATTIIDMNNVGGRWFDASQSGYDSAFLKMMLHEIGHTMGLGDVPVPDAQANCGNQSAGNSVMNLQCGVNDQGGNMPTNVTGCDNQSVSDGDNYYTPPECSTIDADGDFVNSCNDCDDSNGRIGHCFFRDTTCDGGHVYFDCPVSPVLVDAAGDGFALTGPAGGVRFDINGDGVPESLSWTEAGSDDAWLALDRDGNGAIDSGLELFGNFTPQPASDSPNGFAALAEFDRPARGGDGDGLVGRGDAIYFSLRLWRDANHDGLSEPSELSTLAAAGVAAFELDYRASGRTDKHGNRFLYRAKVRGAKHAPAGRWAWDVFLVAAP